MALSHARCVLRESAYHTISMYFKLSMRPSFLDDREGILKDNERYQAVTDSVVLVSAAGADDVSAGTRVAAAAFNL
jgi:hypothetical protein